MWTGLMILKQDGSTSYSPEFRRGGLAAVFTAVVTKIERHEMRQSMVTIMVQHRNEGGSSFSDLGDIVTGAPGISDVHLRNCKEFLRFKCSCAPLSDARAEAHVRMRPPKWRPE